MQDQGQSIGESRHEHPQVPADSQDGDRFVCVRCDYAATFVVLDDGLPGEWVSE